MAEFPLVYEIISFLFDLVLIYCCIHVVF